MKVETMADAAARYQLTISPNEAKCGVKRTLIRKGKRLEATIPAGVQTGSLLRLSGALQITDGYHGDILIRIKVKKRLPPAVIAGIATVYFFAATCILVHGITDESGHICHDGVTECGGDRKPIVLVDNPDATDPTYAGLIAFIEMDSTDSNSYIEGSERDYFCADFAEDVHNNAEAAGIRAAWVAVAFEDNNEAHAINAFETTDKGLVYIDCMAGDTIAYVEKGREYGLIDIAQAESLSYGFYQEYIHKWQAFEARIEAYNKELSEYDRETAGKVYTVGSTEEMTIRAWEARLEEEEQELDRLREELGENRYECPDIIVEDICIYWEGEE